MNCQVDPLPTPEDHAAALRGAFVHRIKGAMGAENARHGLPAWLAELLPALERDIAGALRAHAGRGRR